MKRLGLLVVLALVVASGCGGGTQKISRRIAEEDVAKARYALQHIEPTCGKGHVLVRLSRTRSSCVEPRHAASEVRSHFKCPLGSHTRVDLGENKAECRAVVTRRN
jgi:hypothetical protein